MTAKLLPVMLAQAHLRQGLVLGKAQAVGDAGKHLPWWSMRSGFKR